MRVLSYLGNLVVFVSLAYYVYSYFCVKSFFRGANTDFKHHDFSKHPVSVLKPLKGVFPAWKDNLESFCRQKYPVFEVVVGTGESGDAGLKRIFDELGWCKLKVARTVSNPGPNYKVGNLISAYSVAEHDILVISDADIRVSPRYLKTVVSRLLEQDVGLVTCLYKGVNCENFPARLEAMVVQTDFIPGVLVVEKSNAVRFAFGATIALRKATLESIGGFEVLFPYLADDYQLGNRVSEKGGKVKIAGEIVEHVVGKRRWIDFIRQQLRWAVTCRVCQPVGYFFSILSQGVSLATLNLVFNSCHWLSFLLWLSVMSARYFTCHDLNSRFIKNRDVKNVLWLLPLKDFFTTFIWAASFLVRRVFWAGNYFLVKKDGTMVPVGNKYRIKPGS